MDGLNLRDPHVLKIGKTVVDRIHFQAGHGQRLGQSIGVPLESDIFFQPTQTDFHAKIASEISYHW